MKARLAWLCAGALLAGCGHPKDISGQQVARARHAITRAGCGACHVIPGVSGATGAAGPSLRDVGRRVYIAGVLPNDTATLMLWIRAPQSVLKGNAMPDTHLSDQDAEAITAYLHALR